MAGFPPNYPPSGTPFGLDPRQQARFVRQQMKSQERAQKMAYRAQRDLYRQQTRAMRRTSLLGPILIVAVGVILLLVRVGKLPFYEFESWYGHWWPLLFVAAGIILALEWSFDQYSSHSGVPFVRRGIGGGVIFLLILLSLVGVGFSNFHDSFDMTAHGLHVDADNFGEIFGERHEYEQELDQAFPAGTVLSVENPHGDVTIVGKSGDDKVHIVANKQVYSWNDGDASNRSDRLSPRVSLFGGTLSVTVPSLDAGSADLSITVPDRGQISVNANHGAVNVSDLQAPVNVTSNHGDIELDRIAGPVTVHLDDNGSSFSAHSIHGDVTLRGHADDLNLTEVTGAVSLEGEFYGDTHLEHLAGNLGFRTGRTQLSLGRLDGMLDISSDEELTGSQIVGPTQLHTRSRNISLERIAGSVDITNSNGTVDLTNAAPLGNVSVVNRDGAVTVTVPEHTGLTLQTETRDGGIEDEITGTSIPSTGIATFSKTIGDGAAHVTLHTTHADITLHQGLVEPPSAPAQPQPPSPPAVPAKPGTLKHQPAKPVTPASPDGPAAKSI